LLISLIFVLILLKGLCERKGLRLSLLMLDFLIRLFCIPDVVTKPEEVASVYMIILRIMKLTKSKR